MDILDSYKKGTHYIELGNTIKYLGDLDGKIENIIIY